MIRQAALAGAILTGAALVAPAPAQTVPALVYMQSLTPAAVRIVQDRLRQVGNSAGRIDGVWGADSQAALERFQATHGLQPTGQLNAATVSVLGLNPADLLAAGPPPVAAVPPEPAPPAAVAPPVVAAPLSPAAVRAVQARLRQLNFYRGPADGVWGGATQAGVAQFQQGRGLPPTGQLDAATVTALGLDARLPVR